MVGSREVGKVVQVPLVRDHGDKARPAITRQRSVLPESANRRQPFEDYDYQMQLQPLFYTLRV